MTLYEGEIGNTYSVKELRVEESIMRRLQALGILEGTRVEVLNRKKNGAIMIKVRGTRWALGRTIAAGVDIGEIRG